MAQLKNKKFVLRLDEETEQMIEKLATRNKIPKSQVVRQAVIGLHSRTYRTSRSRHKDSPNSSEVVQGGINTPPTQEQR